MYHTKGISTVCTVVVIRSYYCRKGFATFNSPSLLLIFTSKFVSIFCAWSSITFTSSTISFVPWFSLYLSLFGHPVICVVQLQANHVMCTIVLFRLVILNGMYWLHGTNNLSVGSSCQSLQWNNTTSCSPRLAPCPVECSFWVSCAEDCATSAMWGVQDSVWYTRSSPDP